MKNLKSKIVLAITIITGIVLGTWYFTKSNAETYTEHVLKEIQNMPNKSKVRVVSKHYIPASSANAEAWVVKIERLNGTPFIHSKKYLHEGYDTVLQMFIETYKEQWDSISEGQVLPIEF